MAFESIHVGRPEPAEWSQPCVDLLQRFRLHPVEAPLCIHGRFHEPGITQHAQVLRHGRLRQAKLTLDFADRLFGRDEQAQYRAAVRLRNDFEDRLHILYIPDKEYTCQDIWPKKGPA